MTHDELFELGSSYDEMLEKGISLSGESKDYFIDGRIDHLRMQLRDSAAPPVTSVLDFACGVGDASTRLAAVFDGARVFGVDIAEGAVEEARQRIDDDRVQFGLLDAVSEDESFDLCYVNGAYHHIPPPERAAVTKRIFEMVRPGGVMALFENNPWSPPARLVMRRIPFDRDAQMLRPATARRLLRDAGFRTPTPPSYLFFFPNALRQLRRFEPSLQRVPVGAQYLVIGRRPLAGASAP
jgi:2-polyprenyl-3-methyl-5-hydroxy-6-metoxy-1,4-benzoquinol methylase